MRRWGARPSFSTLCGAPTRSRWPWWCRWAFSWGPSTAPTCGGALPSPPPRAWVWGCRRRRRGSSWRFSCGPLSWASALSHSAIPHSPSHRPILPACWRWSSCSCSSRWPSRFCWGQLGCGESVSNTVGNITGMVLTFLGGTWISLDLMPEAVRVVATFTPVYWLGEGLRAAVGDATGSAAEDVALAVGVLLLFAGGHLRYGARGGPDARDQRRRPAAMPAAAVPEVAPWAPCRDLRRTLRRGRCAARCAGCAIVSAPCFPFAPAGNLWHNTDSRI